MKDLRKKIIMSLLFIFVWPAVAVARDIPAIISTDWLQQNLSNPKLVIMDIRKPEEYKNGHIPGAVGAYYGIWAYSKEEKHMEVPYEDDLFEAIGDVGIDKDSLVVIVCNMADCYYQVQAPRVACTLAYGGLEKFGILDGGYEKWAEEGKPMSKDIVKAKKTVYKGNLRKDLFATRDYMKANLSKAVFVDVREPVLYSGEKKQAFVERIGHIPGSVNLPASEAFTKSGTFKPLSDLRALAEKTVGSDKTKPIITYCDSGKCCPTWTFIFRDVLGYTNVKLYDGGMEEWSKNPSLPMIR